MRTHLRYHGCVTDGAMIITQVVDLVMRLARERRRWGRDDAGILEALEAHASALELMLPPSDEWVPRTWSDVVRGDRVRVSGAEATVESAAPETWTRREVIAVRLVGRDQLYRMPPTGAVEISIPASTPPGSWMREAFEHLKGAGLLEDEE